MKSRLILGTALTLGLAAGAVLLTRGEAARAVTLPNPAADTPVAAAHGEEKAVLAGGCFWGMQLVFEHVKGVKHVAAGYAGGTKDTAQYETVSSGTTGHAESVEVTFDPAVVTYGQILKVYFSVAHDPTELDRQGPDEGHQYRSSIFFTDQEQQRVAQAYIDQLQAAHAFSAPIVTTVTPLQGFYTAEGYHQDYAVHNPDNMYIAINDLPKLDALKKELPDLFSADGVAYVAAQ
ncbi:MAG TPA: peptide-methionine (S)-S-oxide reductase MsrA [Candidatus Cybelea sp.]|nr:peptide-methionine (S)-S-oxide reductase MsrA [Candidatus Cybelea sp.]